MKTVKKVLLMLISILLFSCSSSEVTINGKFAGIKNQKIIIEKMTPSSVVFIDSIRTDESGEFDMNYKFENNDPVFLRVSHKNDFITLVAHPGEKIELNSILNLSSNYTITGSKDSELIKGLNTSLSSTYDKVKQLTKEYNNTFNREQKTAISDKISALYVKQKQENIKFLVLNSKSLASIISLYQIMPNGISIFGDKTDLQYFKLISDSLSTIYPSSPYITSLKSTIKEHENREDFNNIIHNAIINENTIGYPDVALPDQTGTTKLLSELDGKVILLIFWSPQQQSSIFLNRDLKDIYSVYEKKGLEIYQVTLDSNVSQWISIVQSQNLPWISVNDPNGLNSKYIKTYNIQSLPSSYIIDRKGDLVGKNLWSKDLINKINDLL